MGCGGSRNGGEVTESCVDLEGLTGEALQTAMRTHNVKTKWKSHKTPIDMDLLKELGLAGDEDDEPGGGGNSKAGNDKAESEKAKSVSAAKSASVKSAKTSMKSAGAEEEKVEQTENG